MRESKHNDAVIIADEKGYRVLDNGIVVSPRGKRISPRSKNGYLSFSIFDSGEKYEVMVHQLAAFQRFGGIVFHEGIEVRHLNNIKDDNSFGNVSFGSHSENIMDLPPEIRRRGGVARGRLSRKLSEEQVAELRKLRNDGYSIRRLCKKFGLAISTVSYIINRKTYADL